MEPTNWVWIWLDHDAWNHTLMLPLAFRTSQTPKSLKFSASAWCWNRFKLSCTILHQSRLHPCADQVPMCAAAAAIAPPRRTAGHEDKRGLRGRPRCRSVRSGSRMKRGEISSLTQAWMPLAANKHIELYQQKVDGVANKNTGLYLTVIKVWSTQCWIY